MRCRSRSPPTARSASGPSRSAISPASISASIRPRASPTSACSSPPPSAGSATSSTAAPRRWSKRTDADVRAGRRRQAAAWRSPGTAMSSPGSRPAARCSSPRCAPPRARPPVGAEPRRAPRHGSRRWLDAQVDRHLRPLEASRRGGDRSRAVRRASARSPRCWPTPAACCRARRCSAPSPISSRPTATRCTGSASASARSTCSSPPLLKPAAQLWRAALLAVRTGQPMPALPPAGAATLTRRSRPARRRARLPPPRPRLDPDRPCRPSRQPRTQGPFGRRRRSRSTSRSPPRSASTRRRSRG